MQFLYFLSFLYFWSKSATFHSRFNTCAAVESKPSKPSRISLSTYSRYWLFSSFKNNLLSTHQIYFKLYIIALRAVYLCSRIQLSNISWSNVHLYLRIIHIHFSRGLKSKLPRCRQQIFQLVHGRSNSK